MFICCLFVSCFSSNSRILCVLKYPCWCCVFAHIPWCVLVVFIPLLLFPLLDFDYYSVCFCVYLFIFFIRSYAVYCNDYGGDNNDHDNQANSLK